MLQFMELQSWTRLSDSPDLWPISGSLDKLTQVGWTSLFGLVSLFILLILLWASGWAQLHQLSQGGIEDGRVGLGYLFPRLLACQASGRQLLLQPHTWNRNLISQTYMCKKGHVMYFRWKEWNLPPVSHSTGLAGNAMAFLSQGHAGQRLL